MPALIVFKPKQQKKTETFVDNVFNLFSMTENVEMEKVYAFVGYISTEEFDTESITEDMKEFSASNILKTIKNDGLRKIMFDHVQHNIICMFFVFLIYFSL